MGASLLGLRAECPPQPLMLPVCFDPEKLTPDGWSTSLARLLFEIGFGEWEAAAGERKSETLRGGVPGEVWGGIQWT